MADFLFDKVLEEFHCEAEDQSPEEVARMVLRLNRTLKAGDVSFANEVLGHRGVQDLEKSCRGLERIEYASPEDALAAGFEDMDIDQGGCGPDGGGEDSSSG